MKKPCRSETGRWDKLRRHLGALLAKPPENAGRVSPGELLALLREAEDQQDELENLVEAKTRDLQEANARLQNEVAARKQTEADLRKIRDELEQRVAQRGMELESTYKQLLHSEKLNAIGKLSGSIAHEFNNPICGIQNVLEGLAKRAALDGDERELVDMALQECGRISRLIRDLQDFHQPTTGQINTADIHAIMDDVLGLCRKSLKAKRIKLIKNYAAGMPVVKVVPDQLKQVFLCLLENAAEAIHREDGTITVDTEVLDKDIAISVRDTGTGIKAEDQPHIFEPFFSTKAGIKGTGLGLPVSYGIIKRHRGRIDFESEPGKGTIFRVILPKARAR